MANNEKLNAFEYSIFRFIEWYISENDLKNFREFSGNNEMSVKKILCYPFFLCTANGQRKIMFEHVFSNFSIGLTSYIEKDILNDITKMKFLNFSAQGRMQIKEDFLAQFGDNKTIPKQALAKLIEVQISLELHDLLKESGFNDIYDLLDYSVQRIRDRNQSFINGTLDDIKFLSREHSSWRYDIMLVQRGLLEEGARVSNKSFITENSPFFAKQV